MIKSKVLRIITVMGSSLSSRQTGNNSVKLISTESDESDYIAFSPNEFRKFPITKITSVSPDSKKYLVALPSDKHEMGMKTSSLIAVKGPPGEKEISRSYTPITLNNHKGSFELLVKKYPNGVVSGYLDSLKEGDMIEVKGPYLKLEYKPNMKKNIGFLCGGTGITPCLQVIREALNNPEDNTLLYLVFSNHSEADILLKAEIDELAQQHFPQFKVLYLTSNDANSANTDDIQLSNEKGSNCKVVPGRIQADIIQRTMPSPSPDTLIYVCGPPSFMEAISGPKNKVDKSQGTVEGHLKTTGYTEDMVYKF